MFQIKQYTKFKIQTYTQFICNAILIPTTNELLLKEKIQLICFIFFYEKTILFYLHTFYTKFTDVFGIGIEIVNVLPCVY